MSSMRRIIFFLSAFLGMVLLLWSANDAFALLSGDRIDASACSINAYWNCDRASLSPGGIWFSIPVGIYGAAWFLIAALFYGAASSLLRIWLALGLVAALGMFLNLFFIVKAGCLVCYASYLLIVTLAISGWSSAKRFYSMKVALSIGLVGLLVLAGFAYAKTQKIATRFSQEEIDRWYQQSVHVPLLSPLKKGSDSPKLTVVEFSDFGCPFCAKATEVLIPFLLDQKDVAFVFYPFPLDSACNPSISRQVHPYSCEWSKAVLCADQQKKAWALHDALFDRLRRGEHLVALTEWFPEIGINRVALDTCMQSAETQQLLSDLVRVGNELQVTSTPSFFLNGRRFSGLIPMALLQNILDRVRR